jgi:hypothetical protein
MSFKKKGSLSLSINAIVVLVLAISMLGLGLGFTKSMFAKFGSKLDVPPPNIPATEDEPIVLPSDTVKAKINKDLSFSVNIYNDQITMMASPPIEFKCLSGATASSLPVSINAQSQANVMFLVKGTSITTAGTDICSISVTLGQKVLTKQISLEVS